MKMKIQQKFRIEKKNVSKFKRFEKEIFSLTYKNKDPNYFMAS